MMVVFVHRSTTHVKLNKRAEIRILSGLPGHYVSVHTISLY